MSERLASGGRRLMRVLLALCSVLGGLCGAATTAFASPTYVYDGSAITRVDVHQIVAVEAAEAQVGDVRDESVPPSAEARGTSTTFSRSFIATEAAGVRTIADETGQVTSYDSFGQAKSSVGTTPGEDIHHIVEQCQCNASRSGFTPQQVNSTDNLVRLPESVHDEISAFYSSRPPGFSTTVRNSLNGLPWQEQYDFGMDVVQRALNGMKLR